MPLNDYQEVYSAQNEPTAVFALNSMLKKYTGGDNGKFVVIGRDSASRLIDLAESDTQHRLNEENLDRLQEIAEYGISDLPIIPALRKQDDFPIGSEVLFNFNNSKLSFYERRQVAGHSIASLDMVELQTGIVSSFIPTQHPKLVTYTDLEQYYLIEEEANRLPSSLYVNLLFSGLLNLAGFPVYYDYSLFMSLNRLKHEHDKRPVRILDSR